MLNMTLANALRTKVNANRNKHQKGQTSRKELRYREFQSSDPAILGFGPFGPTSRRPEALRPRFSTGLPLNLRPDPTEYFANPGEIQHPYSCRVEHTKS
jgi:hypothetical protein